MNKKIIYIVGVIVLVGVFYGGMLYGKNQKGISGVNKYGTNMQNNTSQFGMNGENNRMIGRPINGEIISKDNTSITVKLLDGGSRIIFFNTNTNISKMSNSSVTDLAINEQVSVLGTINTDGSVTAKTIQLKP